MKKSLSLLFLLLSFFSKSQIPFTYEKEINNAEHYDFLEVDFLNEDKNIKLSGTLITPKSDFDKIVLIVPGSGKDSRYSHFILAEELLKNNIAVYRFDERGVGKSEGNYSELASDLSNDVHFALKKIQNTHVNKKTGIIGHSIGGIAALNSSNENNALDFIVLIETPVIKNGAFIMNQFKMNYENSIPEIMRKGKTKNEIITFMEGYLHIIKNNDANYLKSEAKKYIQEKGFNKRFIALLNDEFLVEMASTNLEETIKNTTVKTLYVTGTRDQIINHKDELSLIDSLKNPNIENKIFEDLNHYLTDRNGIVGSSLYQMDKEPLDYIINWIARQ